jgi:hypothetical protein
MKNIGGCVMSERIELWGNEVWDALARPMLYSPVKQIYSIPIKDVVKVLEGVGFIVLMADNLANKPSDFCECVEPKARAAEDWSHLVCRVCKKPIKSKGETLPKVPEEFPTGKLVEGVNQDVYNTMVKLNYLIRCVKYLMEKMPYET